MQGSTYLPTYLGPLPYISIGHRQSDAIHHHHRERPAIYLHGWLHLYTDTIGKRRRTFSPSSFSFSYYCCCYYSSRSIHLFFPSYSPPPSFSFFFSSSSSIIMLMNPKKRNLKSLLGQRRFLFISLSLTCFPVSKKHTHTQTKAGQRERDRERDTYLHH